MEEILDRYFSALAHAGRRDMIQRLSKGAATLTELAKPLGLSLPAASRHLAVLTEAGLVVSEKRGRERVCRLDGRPLREAEDWITHTRTFWEAHLASLGRYLSRVSEEAPQDDS